MIPNVLFWRAPCKGGAFPVGASPIRQSRQPEAIGAVMEATKSLKPSISVSRIGDSASVQAATQVNAEQASKGAVERRDHPLGDRPTRQLSLQPVAIEAVVEVTKTAEAFDGKSHVVTPQARRLQRALNAEQALKMLMWKPTCLRDREGCYRRESETCTRRFHRGIGGSMRAQGDRSNTGSPRGG